jgi:hypothetical protein
MDDLTYDQLEWWGQEYRRLRHALPKGITFACFLEHRESYKQHAEIKLRDWRENPRIGPMAEHTPIIIN